MNDLVKYKPYDLAKVSEYDVMEIIQNHQGIYTHPGNVPLLQARFEKPDAIKLGSYIAQIRPFQILTDPLLPQYKITYEETSELPRSRFWSWIDDITKPPSYAITWGWVREVKTPLFYLVSNKRFTVKQWR